MKIGIISDAHSNIYGLKAVLHALQDADAILYAGDITGWYTFPNEVIEELKNTKNLHAILGNHDAYLLDMIPVKETDLVRQSVAYMKKNVTPGNIKYLKTLPAGYLEKEIGGLKIKMWHGGPRDAFEERIYPDSDLSQFEAIDADVIVLGHSHWPMVKEIAGKLIINPGSCGQPRDSDKRASFAILDTETKKAELKRAEFDIEAVCEGVRKAGLDEALIAKLHKNY